MVRRLLARFKNMVGDSRKTSIPPALARPCAHPAIRMLHLASCKNKVPMSDAPFLVAPWIEVPSLHEWHKDPATVALLERNGLTIGMLLQNHLDALQPRNTRSSVRLGYMMAINVYDLFVRNSSGQWNFDDSQVKYFTDLFLEVGRPVVINLRANHFVGEGPLADELMADETSLALLNDGSAVRESYYRNAVFAPTFSLDESIPLNHYRFGGFRRAVGMFAEFDRRNPGIIHAITLAGEIHHFLSELADPMAAGRFEDARMTDYSAASVRDFREWLNKRYTGITQLNDRLGTSFHAWEEVEPPRWDLRTERAKPRWMHMDSYANGLLPIFGWAATPLDGNIHVYLNGMPIGQAEYGLNRLDVYEAIPTLPDSDIGFRFDLDYRDMATGSHVIHVVLQRRDGSRFLVGRRFVTVGDSSAKRSGKIHGLDNLPEPSDGRSSFAWLDHPADGMPLLFNPYAEEWQKFREHQVNALLLKFAKLAVEAGMDRGKLYSHQIMSQFEGCWNRVAFAVPAEAPETDSFAPGVDLYGGAAVYRGLSEFIKGRRYAVPELHPRMGKRMSKDVFLKALEYHRALGATFVCPYFMALREPHGAAANPVDALMIHPSNPALGSLFFYTALVEFLNSGGC